MSIETVPAAGAADRSQALRLELKLWERAFAEANGGRKAGRGDIKKDPEIAQKYKEYDRLRARRLSQNLLGQDPATPSRSDSKKRKRDGANSERPVPSSTKEAPKNGATKATPLAASDIPAQPPHHPATLDPYDSLQRANVTPTAVRTSIGPTPQRNGYALGLFDLLSPLKLPSSTGKPADDKAMDAAQVRELQATPCKKSRTTPPSERSRLSVSKQAVVVTPVKCNATPVRHSRTPPSSSRRNFLNAFLMTPTAQRLRPGMSARRLGLIGTGTADEEPGGIATPSFRKRNNTKEREKRLNSLDKDEGKENRAEAEEYAEPSVSFSPVAVRMPLKLVGRPLSALVAGLREMEEEQMDEELDLLREMEAAEEQEPSRQQKRGSMSADPAQDDGNGQEERTQPPKKNMTSGEKGGEGRVWKKRGQKRTTRQVKIQPSTAKWKPEPEWKGGVESDDGSSTPGEETDEHGVECGAQAEHERMPSSKASKKSGSGKEKSHGRPPKKVAATAHPNFRALKIKNKNSKGKRGRFGRRR